MPVVVIRRIVVVSIEDDDLLNALRMRVNRMDMQVAKTQRQRPLLLWCDRLLAQEHHLMTKYRVVQLFKLVIAQRSRQIRPGDLRTYIGPSGIMLRRSLIVLLHAGRQTALKRTQTQF